MKEIIYLTRSGAQNTGDATLQKNVRQRLESIGLPMREVALKDAGSWGSLEAHDIVVSAGGFCCNYRTRPGEFVIYERLLMQGNRLYFWGPGFNEHAANIHQPDYGAPYSMHYDALFQHPNVILAGFRDYGNPHEYVPCASCLDPYFNGPFEHRHEVVILEHEILQLDFPGSERIPKKKQAIQQYRFEEVAQFLGEAETVITNTYHGAYWALLLNKRVVVYKPWSSKFYTLKYTPTFANETNIREAITAATCRSPGFLDEARAINENFFGGLKNLLLSQN
jgi:hypothetical protein